MSHALDKWRMLAYVLGHDMQTMILEAATREATGRQAKIVRALKQIPAAIYGHGVASKTISVKASDFRKVYAAAGSSALIDVMLDGTASVKAIIKDVQVHPLTMEPIHVDFHQVNMTETMTAEIPLEFKGESEAVKALGGTLVKSLDHVEVECLPADLPHEIIVDISVLKTFDDAITVADLVLPKGVVVTNEANQTIASVDAPLTEEELKKMEESQLGDVSAVKSQAEEKKEEKVAEQSKEGNES